MTAPLEGIRVIELARILAGPWAGQTLADLGAEVIKVESPEGDDTRQWGPPFIEREGDTSAAYFHATNRGKKSVTVDFRTAEGQETVRRLVADVGEDRLVLPAPGTAQAEHALASDARGLDREKQVRALRGGDVGQGHAAECR